MRRARRSTQGPRLRVWCGERMISPRQPSTSRAPVLSGDPALPSHPDRSTTLGLDPHVLDEHTFLAAGMAVSVDPVLQILSVRTPDGVPLARLRLLANVDAVEGIDEVTVTDVQVGQDGAGEPRVVVDAGELALAAPLHRAACCRRRTRDQHHGPGRRTGVGGPSARSPHSGAGTPAQRPDAPHPVLPQPGSAVAGLPPLGGVSRAGRRR